MNIEEIREFCLSLRGVSECMPFDDTTLVFKVADRMFGLIDLSGDPGMCLKNRPEKVTELLEDHRWVLPAYHMNKQHWMLVKTGQASRELLIQWIQESYLLVMDGLTRKQKSELNNGAYGEGIYPNF